MDEEVRNCTECGGPVMYGSRHSHCGVVAEKYQRDIELLRRSLTSALAHQDDLIRAAYADAAKVCDNADIIEAADSQYAQLGDARETLYNAARTIECRTPDDARRMLEEAQG